MIEQYIFQVPPEKKPGVCDYLAKQDYVASVYGSGYAEITVKPNLSVWNAKGLIEADVRLMCKSAEEITQLLNNRILLLHQKVEDLESRIEQLTIGLKYDILKSVK